MVGILLLRGLHPEYQETTGRRNSSIWQMSHEILRYSETNQHTLQLRISAQVSNDSSKQRARVHIDAGK